MNKVLLALLFFVSCKSSENNVTPTATEVEGAYIIINGDAVEIVTDEFDNAYLKQFIDDEHIIYVPFPFETEEEEDLTPFKPKQMNEDYQRIHLTDRIYILEEQMRMEKEIMDEINREEAKIIVIDKDNILSNDKIGTNILPFRRDSQTGVHTGFDIPFETSSEGEM